MKKPKRLMFIIMILLTLMSSIAAFATNKPSDITSTVTNLTTGKVVNSDQDYANGIIVYTLDGQNAYFRLRVTNNTNQTLKITGWAEIFTW